LPPGRRPSPEGYDLTQGGTFTLSTEYTRDSSYKKKTDFNIRVYGE
jgi:hypothetical protein